MVSNKSNRLQNHFITCGNNRILKSALLFGANASGKSNFIKAIDFAKQMVIKGDTSRINTNKKYFRIDEANKDKPGIFQFDLEINDKYYCYGFGISYTNNEITSEWLIDTTGKENIVFSRDNNEIHTHLKIADKKQADRFNIYLKDFEKAEMSNLLIITDLAKRTSDITECNILRQIMEWFLNIIVIYPSTHNKKWEFNLSSVDNNSLSILSELDTGIKDCKIEKQNLDLILQSVSSEIKENFKKDIFNALKANPKAALYFNKVKNLYKVTKNDNNEPMVETITFDHGNANDYFEFNDESDGTQRIFDLLPLLSVLKEDHLILIDELDQSLHTKIAQKFYNKFMNLNNTSKAQLVFTTHDILLMDLEVERQDEIWFVEREKDHSSKLYSLSDYKVRCDKNIGKDYLDGRYGAIPVLNE